ncbi:hypothetical protein ACOSP7_000869 [Xanthoceras sorbifolium]
MAEPGRESNLEMEAIQEEERIRDADDNSDHDHSLQQPDTAFLYELNLLIVLLPLVSMSSTQDYFNSGEEEKNVEEIQARACVSRAQTRRRETNEIKFGGRRAPKVHAIKDFRHSRKM